MSSVLPPPELRNTLIYNILILRLASENITITITNFFFCD